MTPIAPPAVPESPRGAAPPSAATPAGVRGAAFGAAANDAAGPTAATAVPNPAMRMDPELGLVVLEFRDAQGELTASMPTKRELDAYRQAARTGAPRSGG